MIKKIQLLILPLLLVAVASCTQNTAPVKADNTARNADSPTAQTPVDQKENDAHNVKVITSGGVVTLRGPVKSQQEKAAIDAKAKQVAGVTRVDNFLEVK